MLVNGKGYAVYAHDGDTATHSTCDGQCARSWPPLLAPAVAQAGGEWRIIDRASGERQWVFRGQPLYTRVDDNRPGSLDGGDVAGWHNVYLQPAPPPPPGFTIQDSIAGSVLADSRGMTVYLYNCGDDSQDQLSCDHPDDTQVYRLRDVRWWRCCEVPRVLALRTGAQGREERQPYLERAADRSGDGAPRQTGAGRCTFRVGLPRPPHIHLQRRQASRGREWRWHSGSGAACAMA